MGKNDERQEDDDWRRVMASGFSVGGIDSAVPTLGGGEAIKHAEDAIDYGEEDELADDEDLPEEEEPSGRNYNDGETDELAALMNEGKQNFGELNETEGHALLSENLNTHNLGFHQQPTLEERVGSEYAQGLMDFDDEGWPGSDNLRLPYGLPVQHSGSSVRFQPDSYPQLGSHALDMDEDMDSDLNTLPPTDEETEQPHDEADEASSDPNKQARLLKQYYPDFEPGAILKMNTLFGPRNAYLKSSKPKVSRPLVPSRISLEVETDQRLRFKAKTNRTDAKVSKTINIHPTTLAIVSNMSFNSISDDYINEQKVKNERMEENLLIATADWDTDHIWNESDDDNHESRMHDSDSEDEENKIIDLPKHTPPHNTKAKEFSFYNIDIYNSDEEEGFFEGTFNLSRKKAVLDMNDSRMLFTTTGPSALTPNMTSQRAVAQIPSTSRNFMLRYNISNDRAYDLLKENYQSRIRSIVGNLNIEHSMVALRLQSPHYKVKLSKAQMRSYHRPTFVVRPNTEIQFAKVKQRKRKRDKGKSIQQLLNKSTDLTLGDSAQFFLMEYSEEFPLMLSNFGMGSKIINYYRKANPEDQSRPKLPTGETNVLGTQDRSAFWNFGFVEPGKIVPTLYNKMIRAPVFKHEPASTDFLLIRSTGGGKGQRYFLRTIPHLFSVGQTFPSSTVPGPHSRKVTTASKNRLKMVVFRVLNKSKHHRILVRDISPHFPGQNEMQNRQRLKEFMEFQRHGDDQGFWKIRGGEALPNEDVIRGMISPEDITLLEAMQVGQQHLEDAGYNKTVDDEEEGSVEEQLAPWNITRNFINATQGKAMLQLHGEGDPSGCGEGFSFLRTSMKGGFKAAGESVNEKLDKSKFGGHSYNVAMQQKAYDEEISRIWYAQAKSLSNPKIDESGWDEAESKRDAIQDDDQGSSKHYDADDGESLFSAASTNQPSNNKVLKITRFVRDENGTVQRKIEVVTEPKVIRAYVKRRQEIEDSSLAYVSIWSVIF